MGAIYRRGAVGCRAFLLTSTLLSGIALPLGAAWAAAPAQTPPAAPDQTPVAASQADQGPGEVTVFARKRKESILNVPVIETVIGQTQLQRAQVVDIFDLPRIATGMNIGHQGAGVGAQVSIRGVGSIASDPGVDSAVSFNIDGLPLGNGAAFLAGTFDLDQIEVLKGPQSLFYGKSTTGGVISLRSNDPSSRFEAISRTAYEVESETIRQELIVSGPVTDTLKLRIAGTYTSGQGYFHNVAMAQPGTGSVVPANAHAPNVNDYIVRGTALWNPTPQFDARLKINVIGDHDIHPNNFEYIDCPTGTGPIFPGAPGPAGFDYIGGGNTCRRGQTLRTPDLSPAAFPFMKGGGVEQTNTYQQFGTLELNYRPVPGLTLSSTTSYFHILLDGMTNGTETTFAGPGFGVQAHPSQRQVTEEVRLTSDFESPVNFTVGTFYQSAVYRDRIRIWGNQAFGFLPVSLEDTTPQYTDQTESAFGQLRWKITPQIEFDGGLRWSDETKVMSVINQCGVGPQCPVSGENGFGSPLPVVAPNEKADNVAPDISLNYKPTNDITLYAAFREAFKSGGFALAKGAVVTNGVLGYNSGFGEESAIGGEVGLKSRWLDRRLTLDVAGYYYRFTGLQVGVIIPITSASSIGTAVQNAGAAVTYGIDADVTYLPPQIEGLTLNAAINWNEAHYITLNGVPCWGGQSFAQGCNQDLIPSGAQKGFGTAQGLGGTPMIRAPEWQANFGFSYEFPVGSNMKMIVANNNSYEDKYVTMLELNRPNNDQYQPAFVKVDLSATLEGPGDHWEVAVIGKNITDQITAGSCTIANFQGAGLFGTRVSGGPTPNGADAAACYMDPGREVWLKLTLKL